MMHSLSQMVTIGLSALLLTGSYVSAQNVIRNCKPGYVALTFDDGPNIYTPALLDVLSNEKVPATFFVNGENFLPLNEAEGQGILKRAYDEGHQIASHTWSHKDLTTLRGRDFANEINFIEEAVNNAIGVRPAFIRPPYGNTDDRVNRKLAEMGYTVALWSTDTLDYESHNLQQEMLSITEAFGNGESENGLIVLSHDVHEQTANELAGEMIRYFKQKNLKFVTVADCTGASAYK